VSVSPTPGGPCWVRDADAPPDPPASDMQDSLHWLAGSASCPSGSYSRDSRLWAAGSGSSGIASYSPTAGSSPASRCYTRPKAAAAATGTRGNNRRILDRVATPSQFPVSQTPPPRLRGPLRNQAKPHMAAAAKSTSRSCPTRLRRLQAPLLSASRSHFEGQFGQGQQSLESPTSVAAWVRSTESCHDTLQRVMELVDARKVDSHKVAVALPQYAIDARMGGELASLRATL
jgi:hypothetical protein